MFFLSAMRNIPPVFFGGAEIVEVFFFVYDDNSRKIENRTNVKKKNVKHITRLERKPAKATNVTHDGSNLLF